MRAAIEAGLEIAPIGVVTTQHSARQLVRLNGCVAYRLERQPCFVESGLQKHGSVMTATVGHLGQVIAIGLVVLIAAPTGTTGPDRRMRILGKTDALFPGP